jgi:hypothetical protein
VAVLPPDAVQTIGPYTGQTLTTLTYPTGGWSGPPPFSTTVGPIGGAIDEDAPDDLTIWLRFVHNPRCNANPATPDDIPVPEVKTDETGQAYINCVTTLGLTPTVIARPASDPDLNKPPGAILDVDPSPGSFIAPGDPITITINPPGTGGGGAVDTATQAIIRENPNLADNNPEFSTKIAPMLAQECLKLATATQALADTAAHVDKSECGDDTHQGKPMFVSGNGVPLEATQHDITALGLNPHDTVGSYPGWFRLTYVPGKSRSKWHQSQTETGYPLGGLQARCKGSGRSTACDEYPFYRVSEGGSAALVPKPHLRIIDFDSNSQQGGLFGNFVTNCEMAARPDKRFLVLPMPTSPTLTNICNAGP